MTQPGAVAARSRWPKWKRIGAAALVVAVAAVAADLLFHLRPIVAEKFWLVSLHSGVASLQEDAILRLRQHPTRSVAVSLVSFIDAKSRTGDAKSAARATETLCILSGRSFGTAFAEHARGHSWTAPQDAQWPEVLAQIDLWATGTLGIPQ
ncbi:MAG: hypothetical protein ACREVG_08940 [Burkholderiales bacterium]